MEQSNLPQTSPVSLTPVKETNQGTGKITGLILVIVLLFIALGLVVYQNLQLQKQISKNRLEVAISPTPTATTNPIANWKTYTNTLEKYVFKYSPDWQIDESQTNQDPNSILILNRDQIKLSIYANMEGIGGKGMDYSGVPIVVSGVNLYEYRLTQSDVSRFGITDILTDSLGVFQANGKTYSITLSYPTSLDSSREQALKTEFELILSTFRFTNSNTVTQNCKNNTLGLNVSVNLPFGWNCKVDSAAPRVDISSSLFTVGISNLGRGPICTTGMDPQCQVVEFYSNSQVDLKVYRENGINKEIFGTFNLPQASANSALSWISIKYSGMDTRDLTASEKIEINNLVNSITFLQ